MVENILRSPELKNWLLNFSSKMRDIGYYESVEAVFTTKLPKERSEGFPHFEEGNIDAKKYVDK